MMILHILSFVLYLISDTVSMVINTVSYFPMTKTGFVTYVLWSYVVSGGLNFISQVILSILFWKLGSPQKQNKKYKI